MLKSKSKKQEKELASVAAELKTLLKVQLDNIDAMPISPEWRSHLAYSINYSLLDVLQDNYWRLSKKFDTKEFDTEEMEYLYRKEKFEMDTILQNYREQNCKEELRVK